MAVSALAHPQEEQRLFSPPFLGSKDSQQVWRLSRAPGPSTLMPGRSQRLWSLWRQAVTEHPSLFLMAYAPLYFLIVGQGLVLPCFFILLHLQPLAARGFAPWTPTTFEKVDETFTLPFGEQGV